VNNEEEDEDWGDIDFSPDAVALRRKMHLGL